MNIGFSVDLIVEAVFALLLAATLYVCWTLERRLKNLRADQEHLVGTIRTLSGAITAAQLSLAGLRSAAKEADDTLGRKVTTARALADELALLNAAGERIAERMDAARDTHVKPKSAPALRAVR